LHFYRKRQDESAPNFFQGLGKNTKFITARAGSRPPAYAKQFSMFNVKTGMAIESKTFCDICYAS